MQLKGYSGSWTLNPAVLTNDYFKLLLGLNWVKTTLAGKEEYRASFEDMSKLLGVALTKEHAGQFIYMSPEVGTRVHAKLLRSADQRGQGGRGYARAHN